MRQPDEATSLCHSCPKLCRHACPVAEAEQDEATTPWGKMSTMRMIDLGHLPLAPETASLAYKCLNCRASESACELKNPVPETLNHFRGRAFQAGVAPAAVYDYSKRFQDHNNPYGIDLLKRLKEGAPSEFKRPRTETAYFAGCTEIRHFPTAIGKSMKLLRGSGENPSLYREPILCCGYPLYVAGDLENFRELAEVNSQALRPFRRVISGTPACLYTMETLYREFGYPVRARFSHWVEIVKNGQRKIRDGKRVAYHDPCYLGRYRNVYEPPRRLIEQATGLPPREFGRSRQDSFCCGAGGLLPVTSPDTAQKITEERLREFRLTGVRTLVSACPSCVRRFQKGSRGIKVIGLIDLLI